MFREIRWKRNLGVLTTSRTRNIFDLLNGSSTPTTSHPGRTSESGRLGQVSVVSPLMYYSTDFLTPGDSTQQPDCTVVVGRVDTENRSMSWRDTKRRRHQTLESWTGGPNTSLLSGRTCVSDVKYVCFIFRLVGRDSC